MLIMFFTLPNSIDLMFEYPENALAAIFVTTNPLDEYSGITASV